MTLYRYLLEGACEVDKRGRTLTEPKLTAFEKMATTLAHLRFMNKEGEVANLRGYTLSGNLVVGDKEVWTELKTNYTRSNNGRSKKQQKLFLHSAPLTTPFSQFSNPASVLDLTRQLKTQKMTFKLHPLDMGLGWEGFKVLNRNIAELGDAIRDMSTRGPVTPHFRLTHQEFPQVPKEVYEPTEQGVDTPTLRWLGNGVMVYHAAGAPQATVYLAKPVHIAKMGEYTEDRVGFGLSFGFGGNNQETWTYEVPLESVQKAVRAGELRVPSSADVQAIEQQRRKKRRKNLTLLLIVLIGPFTIPFILPVAANYIFKWFDSIVDAVRSLLF